MHILKTPKKWPLSIGKKLLEPWNPAIFIFLKTKTPAETVVFLKSNPKKLDIFTL
jgi:hypothetical protein